MGLGDQKKPGGLVERVPPLGCRHAAFTLVELVTSLVIMSVLLAAMGSAILLAARAIPTGQSQPEAILAAAAALRQISEELSTAIYVNTTASNTVTFTLADRGGDGVPEVVRYSWSGTTGDPLTRQVNGSAALNVIENVHQFDLSYESNGVSERYPGPPVESTEQEFSRHDPAVVGANYDVTTSAWIGQYFVPALPADAVSWKVTRALFMERKLGPASGWVWVRLREADASNLPGANVLAQVDVKEPNSTTYMWQEAVFNRGGLTPGQGLCLAIEYYWAASPVGEFQFDSNSGSGYVESLDAGTTWNSVSGYALLHYIYGTYFTAGPTKTVTRQHVSAVRLVLQAGDHAGAAVETSVAMLNTPQVVSAHWELDFNADPRIVDANGDGTGDWVEWPDSSGVIDTADLVDGVWHSPNAVFPNYTAPNTVPDNGFTELTTIEARYRSTSVGGWGANVYVNADRFGNQCAPLCAALQKPNASTQQLRIGNRLSTGTWQWFATLDVPDDFVDVRLVIDPADDTIAAFVDGVHRGTYIYSVGWVDTDAMAWVYSDGCGGEFDRVRIAVGGTSP